MRGTVTAFDNAAGRGVITGDDGAEWSFHAVAIAGGGRTIEVGAPVTFSVGPGLLGRWEATSVELAADPSREGE